MVKIAKNYELTRSGAGQALPHCKHTWGRTSVSASLAAWASPVASGVRQGPAHVFFASGN